MEALKQVTKVIYCTHPLCPLFIITKHSLGTEHRAGYQELDSCYSDISTSISCLLYTISPSEQWVLMLNNPERDVRSYQLMLIEYSNFKFSVLVFDLWKMVKYLQKRGIGHRGK